MLKSITEEELVACKFIDFSISSLPNGKNVLILICESSEGRGRLMNLLSQNHYNLKVFIDPKGNYGISIVFVDSEFDFKLITTKNEKTYPPVVRLHNNDVAFLTTGVLTGDLADETKFECHSQLLRLKEPDIGEALSHASEVSFIAEENAERPSTVVLIFENWGHIERSDAWEAFNDLNHRSKGNPTLEIRPTGTTLTIKIWDILFDLDVIISGLKYSENQLKDFLTKTDPKGPFVLALGFQPTKQGNPVLAGSGNSGPLVVLLKGYVYKTK